MNNFLANVATLAMMPPDARQQGQRPGNGKPADADNAAILAAITTPEAPATPTAEAPAPVIVPVLNHAGELIAAHLKANPDHNRYNGLADANGHRTNPNGLITELVFKAAAASARTYKDETDGRQSKKLATVSAVLMHGVFEAVFRGTVRAVQAKSETVPHVEFNWAGSRGMASIEFDSARADNDMEAFKIVVMKRFAEWWKANKAATAIDDSKITLEGFAL